jgi:hypothetical protein
MIASKDAFEDDITKPFETLFSNLGRRSNMLLYRLSCELQLVQNT